MTIQILCALLIGLANAMTAGLLKTELRLPRWQRAILLIPPAAIMVLLGMFTYVAGRGFVELMKNYFEKQSGDGSI